MLDLRMGYVKSRVKQCLGLSFFFFSNLVLERASRRLLQSSHFQGRLLRSVSGLEE